MVVSFKPLSAALAILHINIDRHDIIYPASSKPNCNCGWRRKEYLYRVAIVSRILEAIGARRLFVGTAREHLEVPNYCKRQRRGADIGHVHAPRNSSAKGCNESKNR